ncbi:hypothetical protein LguiB_011057 [Lonicera macranthoides]
MLEQDKIGLGQCEVENHHGSIHMSLTSTIFGTSPPSRANNDALPKRRHLILDSVNPNNSQSTRLKFTPRLNKKWMEYQGFKNWEGLLDPLDDNLRTEIIRYGQFVESSYRAFDFDPSSPTYVSLLELSGIPSTGYWVTKHLRATSSIKLPRWVEKGPSWVGPQFSWIGYVAVCIDKEEITRLGRRDVVIVYRGTATCLEWLENLRATLTPVSGLSHDDSDPMVESGFLSLYNSGSEYGPSLQDLVKEEVDQILQMYDNEPLSLTITGHSLGAELAILTAYNIKSTFKNAPLVTLIWGSNFVNDFRNDFENNFRKKVNSELIFEKEDE